MFKRLQANNFLSWEELSFDVEEGITLISGYNYDDGTPEGSGKSAVVNALSWGLFGKIPKNVNINDVIREGEKNCKVEIIMDNGYTLVRSRGPNQLYIQDDTGNQVKGIDAKQTQAMIETYIGMSFNTFCQTIYFPQNSPKKFILGTEEDKAKILSELQDTVVFDKARKDVMSRLKETDRQVLILSKDSESLKQQSALQEAQIKNLEELKSHYEADKQQKIDALKTQLQPLSEQVKELTGLIESFGDNETQAEKLRKDLTTLRIERKKLQGLCDQETKNSREAELLDRQISQHWSDAALLSETKICPTCGQDETDKSKQFKVERVAVTEAEIKRLQQKRKEIFLNPSIYEAAENMDAHIEEYEKFIQEVDRLVVDKQRAVLSYETAMKRGNAIMDDIKALENETTEKFDTSIQQLKQTISELAPRIEQIDQSLLEKKALCQRLGMLKDGFKEVKQYVFKQLLLELNERTNQYLAELFEVPVRIEFTNDIDSEAGGVSKIRTIMNFDGVERSIGLLSGGQQKRVEIATDLALSDVTLKRSSRNIKLRIFDEPFQNLSEISMEKVIRLFQRLGGSVIIIEHNSIAKSVIDKTFQIEYRGGVSKRVA